MQVYIKILLEKKVRSYVFLGPRASERGIHGNKVEDLTSTLIAIFEQFKMNNETKILLTYNCEYVFSALIFMLVF
jgi:hypothetical protein